MIIKYIKVTRSRHASLFHERTMCTEAGWGSELVRLYGQESYGGVNDLLL